MRLLALLVLALLAVPLPAWAQAVKIGAVVPLTGRYGPGGAQVRAGYEIAVEQINAAGGVTVGGKKVPLELVLLDDESDATKTVSRLETLAAQGVVGYLGGFGSDLHAAAASVAEKNKTPYLGIAFALNKIHQQGFKYLFSPFWKSPDIGKLTQGLLSLIPAAERPKTVAIFQEKTDWGQEMSASLDRGRQGRRLPGRGARRVRAGRQGLLGPHPQGQGGQRRRGLRDSHAARRHDDGQADEGARLHAQAQHHDPRLRLAAVDEEPRQGRRLDRAGRGLAQRHQGARRQGAERRPTRRSSAVRPIRSWGPPTPACRSWPPPSRKAGAADREKMRDAIAATDMMTVIGPVKFRPDGTGIVQAAFAQWQNGKQELVWPKEFATAPLAYPAPPFAKR